jgi:CRP-like cAMP-binding protein
MPIFGGARGRMAGRVSGMLEGSAKRDSVVIDRAPADNKLSLLSKHWLLNHLGGEELERVGRHVRTQRHRANEVIFRKGDAGQGMMAVLSGRVKISSAAGKDKEIVLTIIDPGEVFGEIALLDGKPRTADATAMEATELIVLDRRDFLPFLERHPEVCLRIINVLCDRIRHTNEQLEDTLFLLQSARLAKALLRLAREYGRKTPEGVRIDLKLSQRELGSLVGMRREGLNRQLGEWRDDGLIAIEGGRIAIRDLAKLEEVAERVY